MEFNLDKQLEDDGGSPDAGQHDALSYQDSRRAQLALARYWLQRQLNNPPLNDKPATQDRQMPAAQPARCWWRWRDRNFHVAAFIIGALTGSCLVVIFGAHLAFI